VPIDSWPDHVAVAVASIELGSRRWRDELGGAWASPHVEAVRAGFTSRQLRYPGGAKLELLEPSGPDSFVQRFLTRFGARIHHVTLKVADLLSAIDTIRAAGYDVVDVATDDEHWHEAFLRPSQVGGLIVQIAWSPHTDAEWAERAGQPPEPVRAGGARLLGPTLSHPDLDGAAALWTTLGGTVTRQGDLALAVRWPEEPLSVVVLRGGEAGPVGLRFANAPDLDSDGRFGPGTLVVSSAGTDRSTPPVAPRSADPGEVERLEQ
jgi:hypothetical protein